MKPKTKAPETPTYTCHACGHVGPARNGERCKKCGRVLFEALARECAGHYQPVYPVDALGALWRQQARQELK